MDANTKKLVSEQFGSWLAILTTLFTVFIIFVSITSWLHSVFDFPVLPYFENSLEDFRAVTHILLESTFYKWASTLIAYSLYGGMLLLEPLFEWVPYVPNITISSRVRDAALVSMILLRSQNRAMQDSNPLTTLAMSNEERDEWHAAINQISRPLQLFISLAWKLVLILYFITRVFRLPFDALRLERTANFVELFVGGCLQLGLAYFVHDIALGFATRKVDSRFAYAHRAFMKLTVLILGAGSIASICFFIVNGYAIASN